MLFGLRGKPAAEPVQPPDYSGKRAVKNAGPKKRPAQNCRPFRRTLIAAGSGQLRPPWALRGGLLLLLPGRDAWLD